MIELGTAPGRTFADLIAELRAAAPNVAIVAVCALQADSVRAAVRAGIEDLLFYDEMAHSGWNVIREARSRTLRQHVMVLVRVGTHPPGLLRTAMLSALESATCVRTAHSLARLAGCTRATLYRAASGPAARSHASNVREVLDWIALTWCLAIKRRDLSWQVVAQRAGMDSRTLRALSLRLTGMSLAALEEPGHPTFFEAVRRWTLP
ncbi:MAG: hypothetical protein C0497_09220 [Gemmatimonas sp.]|nr:hypothetical protein [Gemmatimonas sp.]